jgi:hypothetical protein
MAAAISGGREVNEMYYPYGIGGILVLILVILLLTGRL